jgi:hypothetical protein
MTELSIAVMKLADAIFYCGILLFFAILFGATIICSAFKDSE